MVAAAGRRTSGATSTATSSVAGDRRAGLGHDVTLFASADSITSAELVSCAPEALRLNPNIRDWVPYYMVMLDRVRRMASEFDVLHFHIDALHFPLFRAQAAKTVTTLHGRQDMAELKALYLAFPEMPLVSISANQMTPVRHANFVRTIHHGLPETLLGLQPLDEGFSQEPSGHVIGGVVDPALDAGPGGAGGASLP